MGSRSSIIGTIQGFWYDLSLKLLAWGWLVSLFLTMGLVARTVLP